MSRALIYSRLAEDQELKALGIGKVEANWSSDVSPSRSECFLVLRWGESENPKFDRGNHTVPLTVWAHMPDEVGRDFGGLQKILERVQDILVSIELETGSDGYEVTSIRWQGRSGDFFDQGFKTSTKNALFSVLSHRVPTG